MGYVMNAWSTSTMICPMISLPSRALPYDSFVMDFLFRTGTKRPAYILRQSFSNKSILINFQIQRPGMAYLMDGMGGGYYGYGFPFFGWGMMLIWLVVFLVIGYLVYQDANKRGMNGLLWGILVILPMVGILFLIFYIIVRETDGQKTFSEGKAPIDILKERYAKGEITSEEFRTISEDLKKV
jgi:putative membrane protein